MSDYVLLYILFAPFVGALALIFTSNRQAMLVRGIAAASAGTSLLASLYLFYAYDPVKARQVLADAGYPNGFDLDLYAYRERKENERSEERRVGKECRSRWSTDH